MPLSVTSGTKPFEVFLRIIRSIAILVVKFQYFLNFIISTIYAFRFTHERMYLLEIRYSRHIAALAQGRAIFSGSSKNARDFKFLPAQNAWDIASIILHRIFVPARERAEIAFSYLAFAKLENGTAISTSNIETLPWGSIDYQASAIYRSTTSPAKPSKTISVPGKKLFFAIFTWDFYTTPSTLFVLSSQIANFVSARRRTILSIMDISLEREVTLCAL